MHLSRCCRFDVVSENGFILCMNCGKIQSPALETSCTSYNHSSYYMVKSYSRKSRFEKKVLGLLRCLANHKIDADLMIFLKPKNIKTAQTLLSEISRYPTKGRRPYSAIMYYWKALGHRQPTCTDDDVRQLGRDFDHIFFAWERLGFPNPKFPYPYLFAKIVGTRTSYSRGIRQMVRFVRHLRCKKRRARYDELFGKCKTFEYKNISITPANMDEKKDIEYPEQSISREVVYRPKRMSPYDVKGVYKTAKEMNDAVKRDDFQIAKTMTVLPNGEFYFLTYANELGTTEQDEVSMQDVRVCDAQQEQLRQTQVLDKMLRKQSNL